MIMITSLWVAWGLLCIILVVMTFRFSFHGGEMKSRRLIFTAFLFTWALFILESMQGYRIWTRSGKVIIAYQEGKDLASKDLSLGITNFLASGLITDFNARQASLQKYGVQIIHSGECVQSEADNARERGYNDAVLFILKKHLRSDNPIMDGVGSISSH